MTPDIDRLRNTRDALSDIADGLELELVDDPKWAEPSDVSYLSEQDRANPDIMANVDAMAATNRLIAWFARDSEGFVGLWRGPENRPLLEAPIVRLDSEGQYSIVAKSVGDYLAISADGDSFDDNRERLVAAGFTVGASPDAIWAAVATEEAAANKHRHTLYNEGRVRRGLEPITY
jgi:hypothetical protein